MYREVLALSVHRHRPDFEVLLAPPGALDGEAERFGPHALVHDEKGLPPGVHDDVVYRIGILLTDSMDATIELDGATSLLRDVALKELLAALDEAECLSQGDGGR